MMKRTQWVGLLAAMTVSFGAQAATIDLFSTNQGPHTDNTPDPTDTGAIIASGVGDSVGLNDPTILGGNRDLFVSLLNNNGTGTPNPPGSRNATVAIENGQFDFSTSTQTAGRAQIQWDGNEGTTAIDFIGLRDGGPTGIDLTAGGTLTHFALGIVFSDLGFNFEISLYTDSTNWTKIALEAQEHLVPATTLIPFSVFGLPSGTFPDGSGGFVTVTQTGSGVDLTNLGAAVVDIDRIGEKLAIDLSVTSVTTVPEPSVLALLGLGFLGIGARRFAGRKQA